MWNINAPQGRIPCTIFTKFAEFVPHFRMRWVLKFGWICSRGYGVMGVLSWGGRVSLKFSAPPSGETMRHTTKRFRGERTCSRSSITMPSLVGLEFHPPPGQPKTLSLFVCLSVCSSRFWTSEILHQIWNSLPLRGTTTSSLSTFRARLKIYLFALSFSRV